MHCSGEKNEGEDTDFEKTKVVEKTVRGVTKKSCSECTATKKIALAISATCGTLITVMIPEIVSGYDKKLLNFPNNTVKIECLKIAGSDRYKKNTKHFGGKAAHTLHSAVEGVAACRLGCVGAPLQPAVRGRPDDGRRLPQ